MYLQSYKELKVWQKSIELVEEVYILTNQFPKEETYGLSAQMRRAAISIPSNIAEGSRRKDLPEYLQFLRISDASSAELETQLIISKRLYPQLNYLKADKFLEEIQKMLSAMISSLELKAQSYKLKANNGVAALPTIIIVAMIILLASIGAASSGFVENLISYSELESKKALFAAEAGAKDAFKRIGRNKDCNIGGSSTCASYSIAVGDATSTITVSGTNNKTILSSGQVGNIEVRIQVEAYLDQNNKLIQSSWKQL